MVRFGSGNGISFDWGLGYVYGYRIGDILGYASGYGTGDGEELYLGDKYGYGTGFGVGYDGDNGVYEKQFNEVWRRLW